MNKKDKFVRNPINYIGNKYRILNEIVDLIPSDVVFVDVFGGSGVVGLNQRNRQVIYNEFDQSLFAIMKLFSEFSFEEINTNLQRVIADYQFVEVTKIDNQQKNWRSNYESYQSLKHDYNQDQDNLWYLLTLIFYGFNSQIRFNSHHEFNIPIGKSGYTTYRKHNLELFLLQMQTKEFSLFNLDYEKLIIKLTNNYQDHHNYFFYLDPPYLLSLAPYNSSWNEREEKRLVRVIQELINHGYQFGLNNFLQKDKRINEDLNMLIKENRLEVYEMNSSYQNANYQRKKHTFLQEIYLTNVKKEN